MYEDSWYSFVPELQRGRNAAQGPGHRRRESLLQQPNGTPQSVDVVEPLDKLLEEESDEDEESDLLQAHAEALMGRSRSFPELKNEALRIKAITAAAEEAAALRAPAKTAGSRGRDGSKEKERQDRRKHRKKRVVTLEALCVEGADDEWLLQNEVPPLLDSYDAELLDASQQEFTLYRDQLEMTERHLGGLIDDANGALQLLSSLADSFRAVEEQTTSFQSQCNDLLSEQRRLEKLADEVGTDLYYYAYADSVTRRLNAIGASRLVDDESFGEILSNLDACIAFMTKHPAYRDAETYLARYQSLLTKALHLLEVGFNSRLEKVTAELSKQIAATQSESAQHALAYGRFEELLVDGSYSLIPNVQLVMGKSYDQAGAPWSGRQSFSVYVNTANNLLRTYLGWRDQNLRSIVHKEVEAFRSEAKGTATETASRNFIKQSFERSHQESLLFVRVFAIEPQYSTQAESAFVAIRGHRGELVNAINIAPLATNLQTALSATADLTIVCNVLGWVTHEYLLLDYEDEDEDEDERTALATHSRQLAARLLTEHLWAFADALFEAEIAKTITKAPVAPEALNIVSAANGHASSNAYPPVRHALELLVKFDQAMPKERCQRDSPVVFKIVKETILALQRAEARIKSGRSSTDADLFMIKNLLILKNELLSLEIGDIRSSGGMQHFGQIWDALSMAQNLVGYFSTFIPGNSLWSRATGAVSGAVTGAGEKAATSGSLSTAGTAAAAAAGSGTDQDVSEQLDEALRRSITAFTQKWGRQVHEATSRKLGGKNVAKIERELDELLQAAFSSQPEVVAKLKEAIQIQAEAHDEQKGSKISRV